MGGLRFFFSLNLNQSLVVSQSVYFQNINFRLEAVSLGRLTCVVIVCDLMETGESHGHCWGSQITW